MAVRTPTKKELVALLAAHGIADFVSGGKFAKYEMRALMGILKKLGPPAARAGPRLATTIGTGAWFFARRHPVIFAGSLIAAGIIYPEEREQVIRDIQEGAEYTRELVDELERRTEPARRGVGRGAQMAVEMVRGQRGAMGPYGQPDYSGGRSFGVLPTQTRKKRPSKFNSAVSAGMKAIKKSTSYGGKGKIKPAKKAFTLVTKMAAAKKKKKKAPKSGIRRAVWHAMRGYK